MKYLMLVCWDAENMDAQTEPDPTDTPTEESFPWLDDLQARGIWVTGDQLAPPRRARSVRVRDGKAIVTDGPFAETKEAVGGFDILECGSLEEAVEIARRAPRRQDGDDRGPAALGELTTDRAQPATAASLRLAFVQAACRSPKLPRPFERVCLTTSRRFAGSWLPTRALEAEALFLAQSGLRLASVEECLKHRLSWFPGSGSARGRGTRSLPRCVPTATTSPR